MNKLLWGLLACFMLGGCSPAIAYQDIHKVGCVPKSTNNDTLETVYQTIAMESANQPFEGQIMVARVIINRSRASGRSLKAVCLARSQFSCWNDRKQADRWLRSHYTPKARQNACNALKQAFVEVGNRDIRHYHTKNIKPYWAKGKTPTVIIGGHWFYEGIK